jgi:hypothetical protein
MIPVSARDSEEYKLAKTIRMGRLLETYGPLLTERQREFVRLHYHDDLSFGEIAHDFGVSRQAVHDAVRQAKAAMEHYEAGLGLLARSVRGQGAPPRVEQTVSSDFLEMIIEKLNHLRRNLATQGVIYDTKDYVRSLDEVIARLRERAR